MVGILTQHRTILILTRVRYDKSDVLLGQSCVLVSNCSVRDSSCSSCHSGPRSCSLHLPVDGEWGPWSSWSSCPAGLQCCGPDCDAGSQTRERTCTPPQYGGQDCEGQSQETRGCPSRDCPGRVRLVSVLKIVSSPKILQSLSPPIPRTRVAGGAGAGVPMATMLKLSRQRNQVTRDLLTTTRR